ncbi:MAG: glycosyltransferase family 2 protein [Microbacteriaceae bacterium]|nr:glycosyltransferase family 2 protein [Microbacteriaceae bacterium]
MSSRADHVAGRVGIVTVVYRSDDVLPGLLDSLDAAVGEPYALAIADNLPGEGSLTQRLADEHSAVYVPLPSNPGYGGAINAAVAALPASVEWIVVSNPDVVYRPGSIGELVRAADADDSIGATGPAVENADGTIYPSARSIPSLRTGIGHAIFGSIWAKNPWTTAYRDGHAAAGQTRDVGWLSGSCLVVRLSAFERIGGFDEGYFMYFEDVDLGYRLGKAGYRSVYVPTARAMHSGAHSTQVDSSRMVRAHHDSAKRFLAKKYRGWYLWPVRAVLSVGLDARAAITVRRLARSRPATP